jgi:formyl-CoA transferase
VPLLAAMVERQTRAFWIENLEAAGVPCGPINDLADVFADPQVLARQLKLTLPHPTAGQVSVAGSALKLSATPVEVRRPPPLLGEHTDEVLSERLGLDAERIAQLRASGVL